MNWPQAVALIVGIIVVGVLCVAFNWDAPWSKRDSLVDVLEKVYERGPVSASRFRLTHTAAGLLKANNCWQVRCSCKWLSIAVPSAQRAINDWARHAISAIELYAQNGERIL